LSEIPDGLSSEAHARLLQQKKTLEKDLADFQAAAAAFNAKDAKEQSDAEYEKLDKWRSKYINAAKAFNKAVAVEREAANNPRKVKAYTIQLNTAQGEFSIENSDGSKLNNKNIQTGRVALMDTGTHVTTGPTGRLRIVLPDDTVFVIGPNSDIVMDEFVYDIGNDQRNISVRLSKGIFRWQTGKMFQNSLAKMKVILSVVYIGIRGTDFETVVEPDGSGYVKLFSGTLEMTPKKSGVMFVLKEKNMITFKPDGSFGKPKPIK
jgi:hypothetical protein